MNLKTGRIANGVPSKIDLAVTAQSDKPKLNLDVALKTAVTFDLDKQHYVLEGFDLSAKGMAAGISNLVASAKGDIDAQLASKEFLISKLAIAATGKQEGGDLNVKFEVPKLNVTKDKVSGDKIALDATLTEAKSKVAVKLDIPGLDGNAQAFKAAAMTLSVDMQQDGATIKAKVTSPLTGSVDAEKIELAKLTATVNVNNPKLPKNPIDATINGSALVDLAKQNASLTFATKFDDSNINGKAGLSKFAPPFYTFDINIDQLDADRYLPKSDPKQKQPEQPFDLSALKGLNANGSLKIGSLKVANVKAANVRIDVKAANGRVDVSPIAANLYQGSLAGAVSVQAAATPVITVKQNLTGINVGPLLKDAANFDSLEGKGNVTLDVSGQGNTVSAIKKALHGNAAIKLADGAIKGINIAGSIREAKAKLGAERREDAGREPGREDGFFRTHGELQYQERRCAQQRPRGQVAAAAVGRRRRHRHRQRKPGLSGEGHRGGDGGRTGRPRTFRSEGLNGAGEAIRAVHGAAIQNRFQRHGGGRGESGGRDQEGRNQGQGAGPGAGQA